MPRKISFALTTPQFIARRKLVTRRFGWVNVKAGDILEGVRKSQGLKKGEKVEVLGSIRVVSARREKLRLLIDRPDYGRLEMILEGFPDMAPADFITFFCKTHKGATPESEVTRIRYEYI